MVDYIQIGKNVRRYRLLADMTQEELADACDISLTHMSHIETASTKLSLPCLVKISEILNVPVDSLLSTKLADLPGKKQDNYDGFDEGESEIIRETLQSLTTSLKKYRSTNGRK